MIRKNLKPASDIDPERITTLLRDLDAEAYSTRMAATAELSFLAGRIEKTLVKSRELASAEARRRLDTILAAVTKLPPDRLRQMRALGVLKVIATPKSGALLTEMSCGSNDDPMTIVAAQCRERLRQRGLK
jgi:hypothetical protein